jgi:hypothetical protein
MAAKVFISYRRADKPRLRQIPYRASLGTAPQLQHQASEDLQKSIRDWSPIVAAGNLRL